MKILSFTFLLIFSLISTNLPQITEWNQLNIPGGDVRVIYQDDNNNIYAGIVNGGLYKSADFGSTWSYIGFNLTSVRTVYVLQSGLILAGTDIGLFYKTPSGSYWEAVLQGNPITALAGNTNGDIYAGTSTGVFKSTNGINWSSSGISTSVIRSLAVINGTIYAGTSGQGIYRSTDNGTTWNSFGLGTTYVRSIISHPNGNIIAGTWGGVQKYNGTQWSSAGLEGLDVPDLSVDNSGNIYAATWEGVYKTTNAGTNWTLLGFQETITWSIKVFGDFILTGRDGDGIYKSTDGGVTWILSSNGLNASRIWKLEIKDELLLAGASGGAFKSLDYGNSWEKILDYSDANRFWAFCIISSSEIFAGGSKGVFHSTDGGYNWTQTSLNDKSVKAIKKNPINNYLFAGTTEGVFRSTDNGLTWIAFNGGLTNTTVNDLEILPNGLILAATGGGYGVYKSTNNGTLWLSSNTGLTSSYVYDLFRDVYGKLFVVTSTQIYASSDNAANWSFYFSSGYPGEALSTILIDSVGNNFVCGNYGFYYCGPDSSWLLGIVNIANIQTITQDNSGYVYIGTLGRGVLKSTYSFVPVEMTSFTSTVNESEIILEWVTASELNNRGFEVEVKYDKENEWNKIAFIEGRGTTTEENGYTYRFDLRTNQINGTIFFRLKQIDFNGSWSYSDILEVNTGFKPKDYMLYQNYPNPFNPVTNIKFKIPESGNVVIKLFNIQGEEIDELFDSDVESGVYNIELNTKHLPSGVYLYTMYAGKFMQSRKLQILK